VRMSRRLTESAACLVADDDDLDINFERLLRQSGRLQIDSPRILEVNPDHAPIRRLSALTSGGWSGAELDEIAHLLLDQARIAEGEPVPDPSSFGAQSLGSGPIPGASSSLPRGVAAARGIEDALIDSAALAYSQFLMWMTSYGSEWKAPRRSTSMGTRTS
jgi:hypothetical protein